MFFYQISTLTAGKDYADTTSAFVNGIIPSDFKFTSSSETVTAGAGTLSADDVLIDGSTTDNDVLNATLTTAIAPMLQNIEKINLTINAAAGALDFANISGAKSVSVTGSAAGKLASFDATQSTAVAMNNYGKVLTVEAATLAGTTTLGTAEALAVTLSGTTKDSGLILDSKATGTENLESLTLTSSGTAANELTLSKGTNLDNIDNIVVAGTADLNLKVTSAVVNGNTLSAKDHAGVLTLTVDRNTTTSATTNLANVSGVDNYVFIDSTAGADHLVVSNIADGSNITLANAFAGTDSITVKGAAAKQDNSLHITIDNAKDLTDTTIGSTSLTINDVETLNFTSTGATVAGGNTVTKLIATSAATINVDGDSQLVLNLDASTHVTTVNLAGSGNRTFDFAAEATYADGKNLTIDGHTATGVLTINGSDFKGTTAAGTSLETLTINGGTKGDTITGTANVDAKNVIDAGAGNDIINLTTANDSTVHLGEGQDNLHLTGVTGVGSIAVDDFTLGKGGDKIHAVVSAAMAFNEVKAEALAGGSALTILDHAVANDTEAMKAAAVGTKDTAILVINDSTGHAELWFDANGATNNNDAVLLASFENITTVGALAAFSADNFGAWGA